jgi:hypothetical protein
MNPNSPAVDPSIPAAYALSQAVLLLADELMASVSAATCTEVPVIAVICVAATFASSHSSEASMGPQSPLDGDDPLELHSDVPDPYGVPLGVWSAAQGLVELGVVHSPGSAPLYADPPFGSFQASQLTTAGSPPLFPGASAVMIAVTPQR